MSDLPPADESGESIFVITNWRGETRARRLRALSLYWGASEWHPEPQWLIRAWDCDKGAWRDFALANFGEPPAIVCQYRPADGDDGPNYPCGIAGCKACERMAGEDANADPAWLESQGWSAFPLKGGFTRGSLMLRLYRDWWSIWGLPNLPSSAQIPGTPTRGQVRAALKLLGGDQ